VPCGIQNFDVQVLVSSAAGNPSLYPQVAVRLYECGGTHHELGQRHRAISAVVAELSRLGPGASSTAQVTAIPAARSTRPTSSCSSQAIFQEPCLPDGSHRHTIPAGFSQPTTDSNAGNDVINFWLMRAC
jgi:hypothetical protein